MLRQWVILPIPTPFSQKEWPLKMDFLRLLKREERQWEKEGKFEFCLSEVFCVEWKCVKMELLGSLILVCISH